LMQMGFMDRSLTFLYMLLGNSKGIKSFYDQLLKDQGTTADVASKQLTQFQKGWAYLATEITRLFSNVMYVLGPFSRVVMTVVGSVIRIFNILIETIQFVNRVTFGMILIVLKVVAAWKLYNVVMGLAITRTILQANYIKMLNGAMLVLSFVSARAMKALMVFAKGHPVLLGLVIIVALIKPLIAGFKAIFGWLNKIMINNKDWKIGLESLRKAWEHFKVAVGNVIKAIGIIFEEMMLTMIRMFVTFMNLITGNWDKFKQNSKKTFGEIVRDFARSIEEMTIWMSILTERWFDVLALLPKLMVVTGSYLIDIGENIGREIGEAVVKGIMISMEDLGGPTAIFDSIREEMDKTNLFSASGRTIGLAKWLGLDDFMTELAKTRMGIEMESGRGVGAGGAAGIGKGGRSGFEEMGRKIQDSILDQKKEKLDEKRNDLLGSSVRIQDEILASINKLQPAGARLA